MSQCKSPIGVVGNVRLPFKPLSAGRLGILILRFVEDDKLEIHCICWVLECVQGETLFGCNGRYHPVDIDPRETCPSIVFIF